MASFNQVVLLGNLGKDPEIRRTQSGDAVANFSLATSKSWKDRSTGEKKEKTQWHTVVVFNKHIVGTVEKFLAKGDAVMVVGELETRKWTDKEGNDRWTTEVVLGPFNSSLVITRCKAIAEARGASNEAGGHAGGTEHERRTGGHERRFVGGADFDEDTVPF